MKKVIVNDMEFFDNLEAGELRTNKYYNVLEETDYNYKIENEFQESKYYDKNFFFRYLEAEEIEISEYEDLEEYHEAINCEGFILLVDDEDDRRESSIAILTEEEKFEICNIGEPRDLLELEKLLNIINQFGFNFKTKGEN